MTVPRPADDLPEHERRRLLAVAAGLPPAQVAVMEDLPAGVEGRFAELAERRRRGEPLQYLEGSATFASIEVAVDSRALIPRPETEQLWELAAGALAEATADTVIVELGTGSGALALALKDRLPAARVYATDVSPSALELAAANAAALGLDVTYLQGDLWDALPFGIRGNVDLLVTNPPYVSAQEWEALPTEIRDHEPRRALVGGERGTEVIAAIAAQAFYWVKAGGRLFCEIGSSQADEARQLFGAFQVEILHDLAGRPRFVSGYRGVTACIEGSR